MKRLTLLSFILCCFVLVGCSKNPLENKNLYEGRLIISGIGPEMSFEPTVDDGTLVLNGSFDDHSDHLFFSKGLREEYFKNESDFLPGNTVNFRGLVVSIDGAAGNHYYEVKSIDMLEFVRYPAVGEIKDLFEGYNYCENDSDCGYFVGECPLGCYIPLNVKYIDIASNIVTNFVNHLGDGRCVYDCIYMDRVVCEKYKCVMMKSAG